MPTRLPIQLMTAPERAGYREACIAIRAEAARMRRAARLIPPAPCDAEPAQALEYRQKNQILELAAKAVELCVERAERALPASLN